MVDDRFEHETDRATQVKRWWQENGQAIVIGVALGIAGLVGWQLWEQRQVTRAENASIRYNAVLQAANQGNWAQVVDRGEPMREAFGDTPYASLTSLLMARAHLEQDNPGEAAGQLTWVVDNAAIPSLQEVARLRLARLFIAVEAYDSAMEQLDAPFARPQQGLVAELKGDIHRARGELEAARTAYQKAQRLPRPSGNPELLSMKLAAVGGAPDRGTGGAATETSGAPAIGDELPIQPGPTGSDTP
jgi:predicted negative regulator of RcsB-dependent stress response